jgi:hypothetical protein
MAPDMYFNADYTSAVDVYSFSLVCYELLVGQSAFPRNISLPALLHTISTDVRPKLPKFLDPSIVALIERCWSSNPKGRPSFDDIFDSLLRINFKLTPGVDLGRMFGFLDFVGRKQSDSQAPPIFVRDKLNGNLFLLSVSRTDRPERVKRAIEEREGIMKSKQCLVFSDQLLDDGKTLQEYSTRSYSILDLYRSTNPWPSRDTMPIQVRYPSGRHVTIQVSPSDDIGYINETIERLEGLLRNEYWLSFAGKWLEDGKTVRDYAIQRDAIIRLDVRPGVCWMHIFVKTESKQRFPMAVEATCRVCVLKLLIQMKHGILLDRQLLSFAGQHLKDSATLQSCLISDGSTVHLVVIRYCPPPLVPAMRLFVAFRYERFTIGADQNDRIIDLKVRIEEQLGIPANQQRLLLDVNELVDHKTLAHYSIRPGSFLHSVHRPICPSSEPFRIFIEFPDGRRLPITVAPATTIADLKARIEAQEGFLLRSQILRFARRILDDDKTLRHYFIDMNSTLSLLIRQSCSPFPSGTTIQIIVRHITGETYPVAVKLTDRILDLKMKIACIRGIPAEEYWLISAGCLLEDDKTIQNYSMLNGSTVYLSRRL